MNSGKTSNSTPDWTHELRLSLEAWLNLWVRGWTTLFWMHRSEMTYLRQAGVIAEDAKRRAEYRTANNAWWHGASDPADEVFEDNDT